MQNMWDYAQSLQIPLYLFQELQAKYVMQTAQNVFATREQRKEPKGQLTLCSIHSFLVSRISEFKS